MVVAEGGGADNISDDAAPAILKNLIARAHSLLAELETFREHLSSIRQEKSVEDAHFKSTVKSELSMLQRLALTPDDTASAQVARSSNLPFLEAVWNAVKKSKSIATLQKRILYKPPKYALMQGRPPRHDVGALAGTSEKSTERKSAHIVVDAIADAGRTWIKVSLLTKNRLLFDLAKEGWYSGSSDEEEGVSTDPEELSGVPLLKTAREMCLAAQQYRVRTKRPNVHILLPRITLGETAEIDAIIDKCKAAGAKVFCGEEMEPAPSIQDALQRMAPNPCSAFSETLNIDCTILLALVSEFSHAKVSKEPWFHPGLQRQVEIEGNENLLHAVLYPAIAARRLVCTKEAVVRMREIVDTIGTSSEKARTAIMLGDDATLSQRDLIRQMQEWSAYEVPEDWQLPIRVVDQNQDDCQSRLPAISALVRGSMTNINKSVFLYGWASGRTTLTSNRTVVKQLNADLNSQEDLDDEVFPHIWVCPTSRSLVGKEKRGAKKESNKEGAWPLPDPLRREEQRRNGLDVLSSRAGHQVEDLRPNGYPCDEVLEAKNAARREAERGRRTSDIA